MYDNIHLENLIFLPIHESCLPQKSPTVWYCVDPLPTHIYLPHSLLHNSLCIGPLVKKPVNNFSENELYPPKSTPVHNPPFPPNTTTTTPLTHKHGSTAPTSPLADLRPTTSLPIHLTSSLPPPDRQNRQVSDDEVVGIGHKPKSHSESPDTGTGLVSQSADDVTPVKASDQTHRRTNSDFFVTPISSPPPSPIIPSQTRSAPARVGDRVPAREARLSERILDSFFSKVPNKFEGLVLEEKDQIPTQEFLECCRAVVPFFG